METNVHFKLKRFAAGFLRSRGCQITATEVRCPISRYRVDVAGYLDRLPSDDPASGPLFTGPHAGKRRPRVDPRTVVIECKCSRSDFLRDHREADKLLAARDQLERMRHSIEERRVKLHEPHLRQSGTALFPELEVWDFSSSRLRGYRQVLRKIRILEEKLHGETKFFTIAHYRLADHLYLAAPRGLICRRELPRGWGLLECSRRALVAPTVVSGDELRVVVMAPPQSSRPEHRLRLLRNIAMSACRKAETAGRDSLIAEVLKEVTSGRLRHNT